MASKSMLSSSLGKKYAMALSALFLLIFLTQHFLINILSVFNKDAFNAASHFMGYNPFVQFLMQPLLIIGIIFHFTMGIILELQNRKARGKNAYAYSKPNANSTWMSRNMIWTGLVIEFFIIIHMANLWWHEMTVKYIQQETPNPNRYYDELVQHFQSPIIVGIYVVAFVFLGLHLMHGFQSAFQSMGANHRKYTPIIKSIGKWFSILIPAGFIFIAIFHFLSNY